MKKKILIATVVIVIILAAIGEYFFNYAMVNKVAKGINVEYIKRDDKKLAVILHGYKTDAKRMENEKDLFMKMNYSILMIDNQSKYYTFGKKEKRVLIDILKEYKDKDIVLYGMSMGAATVLQAAVEEDFPKNVKMLIVDSPYDDIYSVFKTELKKRFNLPAFPILPLARMVAFAHLKIDIKGIKVSDKINNTNIPILFLHGGADTFVYPKYSKKIYDAYKGKNKKYVLFPNVGHSEMDEKCPDLYEKTIREFIEKVGE